MPGATPRLALPYPLGTDPIASGDDIINQLATKLEALNIPLQTAAGTINIQASALAAGTAATFAVNLPVGRFTVPPLIMVTLQSLPNGSASATVRAHVVTAANFYIALCNTHPTSSMTFAATPCGWLAVQMTAAAAPGLAEIAELAELAEIIDLADVAA